ncbi:MAG: acyl-protein synthetase [Candidatus Eremiobacteraeota bacterium]|nr:acyl-protein synthetase [Candidatus Eremiobacteraeota bacterium]
MPRRAEAAALDARILAAIAAWDLDDAGFDALARDLFVHQVRYNPVYAAFAARLGFDETSPPPDWRAVPALPTIAFKEATVAAFDPADAALCFETSGTTASEAGKHYFETPALYDAALLASFARFMLEDGAALRYLLLIPERASSSLGYMMRTVAAARGDGSTGWYLRAEALDVDGFLAAFSAAHSGSVPVCVAGTAFAFVALVAALAARGLELQAPRGSRIMETGGFKGRSETVERSVLYAALAQRLGIPAERIVAEYGMTELTSQYYDAHASRSRIEPRVKVGPPWLRALVVGADGREVEVGEVGALRHVDLANRGSALAIQTEDLALRVDGAGFVLLGRDAEARLRGCSLDAEDLLARPQPS